MKIWTKTVRVASVCALSAGAMTMMLATPAAAQLNLGVGGGAGANVNPGGALNGAGNAVQNATQGAQRAVQGVQQGVQQATQGAQNLTRNSVQRAQQGAQNLSNQAQAQAQRLQGSVNAQGRLHANQNGLGANLGARAGTWSDSPIPQVPAQVRANANANVNAQANRNARWRRMQHNGEWWYYGPDGNWMYHRNGQWNKYDKQNFQSPQNNNGNRRANYRGGANGDMRMRHDGQPVYRIRTTEDGSQFINLNGRRVFIESSAGASVGGNQ